ncbi:MAG TPA: protein kinase [Vicinamibacterales bacterium]|nr:protein kinase [Vicinamibacterales bacterium]
MSNDPTLPGSGGNDETKLSPQTPTHTTGWLSSSGSIDHGRFEPGTVIQQRYRVIGLLGRGGMGEVYRADDLRLGQAVALKFLPAELSSDAVRLTQFHNEIRTARHVSHPNVCRMYDIGEADGQLFLTMEYVDGEDLSSLLRRIGRLPEDKAIEIARQICAGLAAAHERGIIHRDLKPANIMLDGSGKVRIMDFSLAAVGPVTGIAGTPAYMAPEQLAGRDISARSDVYALGLVLFELFTGKRAFDAKTINDLIVQQSSGPSSAPTALVTTLDPTIERAILRCLDLDPARRPASPLAVAAALPGGDPLAAALAAGETPSPEMVAAAGGEQSSLTAVAAVTWLALVSAMLLVVSALADRTSLLARIPLTRPAPVLIDRAEELRQSLGYAEAAIDQRSGFAYDTAYLGWNRKNGQGETPWQVLAQGRPAALVFWRRTSPEPLVPMSPIDVTDEGDPPLEIAGMTRTTVDTRGRLVSFMAVPAQLESKAPVAKPAEWAPLFAAAGLDLKSFSETAPSRTPQTFADERKAWTGELPETHTAVTVEAAAYRGRPVSFEIIAPWTAADREPGGASEQGRGALPTILILALLVSAVVLARRNLQSGRADRRGAFRLAAFHFFLYAVFWLLLPHLSNLRLETQRLFVYLGLGLFIGGVMYLVYLAIEPFVRRSWPTMLVGWSRALAGRFPDPLIGRDVLVGIAVGLFLTSLDQFRGWLPQLLQWRESAVPAMPTPSVMEHGRYFALTIGNSLNQGLQNALLLVLAFASLRELVKRAIVKVKLGRVSADVAAAVVAVAGMLFIKLVDSQGDQSHLLVAGPLVLLGECVFVIVLLRFGLLAVVVMDTVNAVTAGMPLTLNSQALYAGSAWTLLALILLTALGGAWMARGWKTRPGLVS